MSPVVIRNMTSKVVPQHEHKPQHFNCLQVSQPRPFVFHVELHRPNRHNAFSREMWIEIKSCLEGLSVNPDCRAIVISAAGKHFTAGIDLSSMMQMGQELGETNDVARKGYIIEQTIKLYQDSISSLELCPKPVITAVHSGCIGAGVNLITAADIRYCSQDAFFSLKEIDVGLAADVGALQRLPKVIGSTSLVRELCFTGRRMGSAEAKECGLVSKVFANKEELVTGALDLAEEMGSKSPIAMQNTKKNLVYSQDRSTQDGLDQINQLNKLALQSDDFVIALEAQLTKSDKRVFSKL